LNLGHLRGVIFDFDGTLAPNLDLPEMRRRVIELTLAAGVPEAIFEDHYIIEIIEAATQWLRATDASLADTYHAGAHQRLCATLSRISTITSTCCSRETT
jgi:hypothetical protein